LSNVFLFIFWPGAGLALVPRFGRDGALRRPRRVQQRRNEWLKARARFISSARF
jgi:hypothetical protein